MVLIAIGSNLASIKFGSPLENCLQSVAHIRLSGIHILANSPWYRSQAQPDPGDPEYVNGVVSVDHPGGPESLLETLQNIEIEFGRIRSRPNAPRVLDLDLIAYRKEVIDTENLILPHPRMLERAFVMVPLADIAPGWRHPVTGEIAMTVAENLRLSQKIARIE